VEKPIQSLNQFQEAFSAWKTAVTPPEAFTPHREQARSLQEEAELTFELAVYDGSPESKKKVAEEAVDVIFGKLGVIASVGFNLAELVNAKMEIILEKYPEAKVSKYRAMGWSHEQVMEQCKKDWDLKHQKQAGDARKYWVI
jgi:DNA replication protein DnaC